MLLYQNQPKQTFFFNLKPPHTPFQHVPLYHNSVALREKYPVFSKNNMSSRIWTFHYFQSTDSGV